MKTLITRSLSGIVFAAIMLLGIWYSRWSFTILFLIVNLGCLWEYFTITKSLYTPGKVSANVYRGIGIILGTIIYMLFAARSMWLLPSEGVLLFIIVFYGFMMLELLSLAQINSNNPSAGATNIGYQS